MEPSELKTWALAEDAVRILRELQRRAEARFEDYEKVIDLWGSAHVKIFRQLFLNSPLWVYPHEMVRLTGLSRTTVYNVYDDLEEVGVIDRRDGAARRHP